MTHIQFSALSARLAALLIASATPLLAQAPAAPAPARLVLQASRATDIRLDGRLDEAAWATAQVGTDFTQRFPDPGKAATMPTEVRVLYDESAIYVGARMYDPHPDSIAAPLARRDPGDVNSDWIDVIFDSYNDRRTAYRFGVNPAGTKLDVYHFNDSDDDVSWDALWDVATRIDSLGWTAEYRIPLSQLRFHGSAGEQTWGLNFYRAVARRDEWTFWSPYPPSAPGFVSAMGELRGLVALHPPAPLEVTPYVSSRVVSERVVPGDPFGRHNRMAGTAGVDFRIGLGSALTLTGTVNPDFGQVEVDPAIINLSAVETFLPEKRPFFLEGLGIFQFGGLPVPAALSFSQFVHWRRIGRAPQLSPGAAWIDAPEQATILGAAKVSGQLPGGWSLGIADAVTQREEARMADTGGERGTFVVEPLANYFVGRAKRDFNDGRATVGVLTTATNRSLDGASAASLRSSAYLMGMDASIASSDRRWRADGFFVQARVAGTAEAIASTQRSSVRFLQRPDKDYALYDPTRTSLSGHDASLKVAYQGQPWFGGAEVRETTPGYEANDLGYMSRADTRTATLAFGGIRNNSASLIRSLRVTGSTMSAWNFGGNLLYQRLGVASSAQFSSFWTAAAGVAIRPPLYSDKHTRGGPLVNVAGQWEVSGDIATDSRRKVRGMLSGEFEQQEENGTEGSVSGMVIVRPSPSLQFSATPRLDLLRDEAQYVRTVPDVLAARTYDNRYVFATLRQRTVSVDLRGDWTLTPALSLQLFAQPFVSTARFDGYKELRIPGTFEFDVYGRDAGTVVTQDDGTIEVDPDGAGAAAAFLLGTRSNETSFVTRALRLNAVARWEYRGGSALFLIWQQSRDADGHLDGDYGSGSIGRVLDVPARNTLLVKASYRLGR